MSANFLQGSSLVNLTGYVASTKERSPNHRPGLTLLMQKALKDPAYSNRLCDRVYQIMLRDLQRQQKRSSNYSRL